MDAQLVHVGVVLGHDGDGITLLANDQPRLLLRGDPQVDAVELVTGGREGGREGGWEGKREGERERERERGEERER